MRRSPVLGVLLLACADGGPDAAPAPTPRPAGEAPARLDDFEAKSASTLTLASGVDGRITTLDRYGDGSPHRGVNAIDVGAPGGAAVWHQLDFLPPEVAGGWVQLSVVREAGTCSQWAPDSRHYNGSKIIVETHLYDVEGAPLGWHRAAYQHVEPGETANGWYRWNNAWGTAVAWPDPDYILGNRTDGGVPVGAVFRVSGEIYNGPGGGLCTDGPHLHQEGAGVRAPQLRLRDGANARVSGLHVFQLAQGPAPGGEPPWTPFPAILPPGEPEPEPPGEPEDPPPPGEPEDPPPPDEPEPEPPPAEPTDAPEPDPPPAEPTDAPPAEPEPASPPADDPCVALGYTGRCEAGVLTWCENGVQRWYDCVASGLGCGWQDEQTGWNCVPGCGDLDYRGACQGAWLRWCENGALGVHDCGADGRACGWQDESVGHNCLR